MSYYALNDYVSDGEQLTYAINWSGAKPATSELPYLSRDHVKVYEMTLQEDNHLAVVSVITDFSFIDDTAISLANPVVEGNFVRLLRETPSDYNITRYSNTLLRAADFENTQRQLLFIAQETSDRAGLTGIPIDVEINAARAEAAADLAEASAATAAAEAAIASGLVGNVSKKFTTYAAQLADTGTYLDGQLCDVTGYHSVADGGEITMVWIAASTATHNGGTVRKPTAVTGAGRWLAVNPYKASFEQFGSKGDDVTDNTSALTSLMSSACTYVYAENGVHVTGALTISTSKTITAKNLASGLKLKASANADLLTISSDNVSILDMLIDGNKTSQSGTSRTINTTHGFNNIRIMRNRIKNAYSEGVRVQGAFNVMIKDNHIDNCHQTGNQSAIVVRNETGSSKGVRIINNYIDQRDSSNGCIKIQSAHATYRATDILISQNTCLIGDPTIDGALGIECFTLSGGEMMDVTIANNVVECTGVGTVSGNPSNYYAYGISIGGQSTTDGFGVKGCTISGNNIRNCRRIGLEIIGRRITATGNTLEDSAEISINADDVASGMYAISVVGNTLYNTGGFGTFYGGIRVRAITQSLYGLTITGNTIYKTSGATTTEDIVFVQGGNGSGANTGEIYDVIIADNNLNGISRYGVHLQSDTSIHNAQIKNNAFRFDTAATTGTCILSNARAVNGLSIVGNTFRGVGAQNTDGITLNGLSTALSVKVQGNTLDVCRNGILTSGSCNTLNVSDNIVKLSSGVGITIGNSPTNVVYENNLFVTNGTNESLSTTIVYSMASIIQGLTIGANKNIASGVITITGSSHIVDTEAAAATDDLDTINGASFAGQELLLKSAVTGRTVVLKDATGNLRLAGDFSLDHIQDTIRLHWNGAQWCEISRSNNS